MRNKLIEVVCSVSIWDNDRELLLILLEIDVKRLFLVACVFHVYLFHHLLSNQRFVIS